MPVVNACRISAAAVLLAFASLPASAQSLDAMAYGAAPASSQQQPARASGGRGLLTSGANPFTSNSISSNPFNSLREMLARPAGTGTAPVTVMAAKPGPSLDAMAYNVPPPPPPPLARPGGRGLFTSGVNPFGPIRARYARPAPVLVATAPMVAAVPVMPAPGYDATYRLDAGDRLRIVVYGQEGLTNGYAVGATGAITMPLIGPVAARGLTLSELAGSITARLRNGYIRDPSVAVEIDAYRPFFILGEVAAPGQYPYVPNMTVESAVAIAGGFSPRAKRSAVTLTHTDINGTLRLVVPPVAPVSPGDTILVGERWF